MLLLNAPSITVHLKLKTKPKRCQFFQQAKRKKTIFFRKNKCKKLFQAFFFNSELLFIYRPS